jgi:hypothetical protein
MEHEVLKKMREIIGFPNGDSILAPGIDFHHFLWKIFETHSNLFTNSLHILWLIYIN